jgi:hypothetical protein
VERSHKTGSVQTARRMEIKKKSRWASSSKVRAKARSFANTLYSSR